jgi:hypothetical protein
MTQAAAVRQGQMHPSDRTKHIDRVATGKAFEEQGTFADPDRKAGVMVVMRGTQA